MCKQASGGHINKSTGFWDHMKYKQLGPAKTEMSVETCDIWKQDLMDQNIMSAEDNRSFHIQKFSHFVPPWYAETIWEVWLADFICYFHMYNPCFQYIFGRCYPGYNTFSYNTWYQQVDL